MTAPFYYYDPRVARTLGGTLRAAESYASQAYGDLTGAYLESAQGRASYMSLTAVERLTEALDEAATHAYSSGRVALSTQLSQAREQANHVRQIAKHRHGGLLLPGEQLDLLRASHSAQQLVYHLNAARLVYDSERSRTHRPSGGRSVDLPPRTIFSAEDLRLPPGMHVREITLPGTLIAIAVLMLPSRHRRRYSEEFRSEVRDLPANEQVGYACRQCLMAVMLRGGLMSDAWRKWLWRREGNSKPDDPSRRW